MDALEGSEAPERASGPRRKRALVQLLGASVLCLCAATVLTCFGRLAWWCDLFTHFRWQMVTAAVILAGSLAVLRATGWAALAMVPAAVNGLYLLPLYFATGNALAPVSLQSSSLPVLDIVVANVLYTNEETDDFLAYIRETQPDLIVMIEFTEAWGRAMETVSEDYPFSRRIPRTDAFGIAMYSRVPWTRIEEPTIGATAAPCLIATFVDGPGVLTVIGCHTVPPRGSQLTAERNHQLRDLAALARRSGDPVVIVGDLNTTPWSSSFRDLLERADLSNGRLGHGVVNTWPVSRPYLGIPIDHVLTSDELSVASLERGPDVGSDHYPLWLKLRPVRPSATALRE